MKFCVDRAEWARGHGRGSFDAQGRGCVLMHFGRALSTTPENERRYLAGITSIAMVNDSPDISDEQREADLIALFGLEEIDLSFRGSRT